jgi:hypothetical protein
MYTMGYLSKIRFFLLLAALLSFSFSLHAQIRVEKTVVGLDGFIRGDRWIPIVFQISNFGPAFQGTLQVSRGETLFQKTLELGPGATRKVEILVFIPNYTESLGYRILDSHKNEIKHGSMNSQMLNYQDNLILVVSDSDYNHQFLSGIQNPWGGKTFVGYLRPADLYSSFIAYSTADVIAIGSLSAPQLDLDLWKALLLYGAAGGTLVASPFTDFSALQDSTLQRFLPSIAPELSETTRGEFLAARWSARSSDPFPQFEIPAQKIQAHGSDLVLAETSPANTLITSSPFYKGNIIYFGFDYSRVPESIRVQFASYWNETIFPSVPGVPVFGMPFRSRLEDNPRVQRDLYDIPGLKLPDMKWFALFFFVYLIVVGPVQYFALNVLKKNAMLWITFPLIIFLFTAAAIGYSKYRHSSKGKITQIAVIEAFPELHSQTTYQVYGSAFSESGEFDFQAVPENSYLTKAVRQTINFQFEPFVLIEDLPHTLTGESLKTWTFRTFDAISSQTESTGVQVNAQIDGTKLYGSVRNNGPYVLRECFFLYDRLNSAKLQIIEPGETRKFEIELDNRSTIPMAEPHLRSLLDLNRPSHNRPHFFLGQVQDGNGEIKINGKSKKTDCTRYITIYVPVTDKGPANAWTQPLNPAITLR